MKSKILILASLLTLSSPALAHHSAAMFDQDKTLSFTGTVRELQWSNPHCWLQLIVTDGGKPVEWSIEMGAPFDLLRGGWKRDTIKPGDKITVEIHPQRDGSHGALMVSAEFANGEPIGKGIYKREKTQ